MVIIVMLYGITTIYAVKLQKQNKNLIESKIDPVLFEKIKTENTRLKRKNKELNEENSHLKIENKRLNEENDRLQTENIILQNKLLELNDKIESLTYELLNNKKPPLITLSEDEKDFRFTVGKAKITNTYKEALHKKTLPELMKNINEYNCDTVEVYGFTDTQPYTRHKSIDEQLRDCIDGDCDIDSIKSYSNLDLGMKRAISIVHYLKKQQALGNISKDITIKPYSAGQFIDEQGKIAPKNRTANKKRRRIEIRISRSKKRHKD